MLSSILEHMHPQWIISYHEHDSLLEHVFDEELSEAERKAAWENYKAEKQAETARYGYLEHTTIIQCSSSLYYTMVSQRRAHYPNMSAPPHSQGPPTPFYLNRMCHTPK